MCSIKRVPEHIVPAFGFPEEAVLTAAATTAAAVTTAAATTGAASTVAEAAASTGAAEVAATDSKSSPLLQLPEPPRDGARFGNSGRKSCLFEQSRLSDLA
jgi:hypothetical protein